MSSSVTIRRCASLPEAVIVNGLLQAHGIPSSIDNYYHATNQWWYIPALGGVAVSVPQANFDEARQLIIDHAAMGPELIEEIDGPYEEPRRYGVFAIWFMLLDYTLQIPTMLLSVLLGSIVLLIAPFIPQSWWKPSDANNGGSWIPDIGVGGRYTVTNTTLEPEGLFFLILVILVFLADRLINPREEIKDDTA
ncbi:putative signal transducing protein [Henriciella litoralis]|uniref:DUF2007 domain-containing protein n=1 Tax=Henriciella litoralis TaxID=568102 RepID=UPI0009FFD70C|nr:DUF2007 domain-containing protein [Henriciella litoralis]